ncbi:MAG: phosphoribosylformylglycinamidine synthase subunit PurL [Candidatus Diapherotrites archaeon]|nr:phosphoribosylformylglycinamidine synthase subunit PurL [Candidatus Diapherotrites archaeon]
MDEQEVSEVKLLGLSEKELLSLSEKMLFSLNLAEMKAVQDYFERQKRSPTDAELETIAQTWSEHCKHKVFNCIIEFEENQKHTIHSLFQTFIAGATKKIAPQKKGFLLSVFSDNAGIISLDRKHGIAVKVETHNHPSALEPYGGANTGVGGVLRDILGAGLGAKPIACTDVFCFAHPKTGEELVPEGVLAPKRIFKGVRAGVRDYGNQMGVPTVNGAIVFDKRFVANPLVYCGAVGIIPKNFVQKKASVGELIVACGARTGNDGIHGATFSSAGLLENIPTTVVQIGNAIEERKLMDFILRARDKKLFTNITDCGAGGFSSAIGEMAKGLGARVDLKKVPLKYKGLLPWQIWVSESQERMVLSVPRENLAELFELAKIEEVEISVLGEFTSSRKLEVFFGQIKAIDLELGFLHKGLPSQRLVAKYVAPVFDEPQIFHEKNLGEKLHVLLQLPNIASKETTIRQYDHEVQGGSVLKPLSGLENDGPSDAAIVRPLLEKPYGVVIANGINPFYGDISPYWMAASNIDEAIRNSLSAGAEFEKMALLDNFCWASPMWPIKLGELVKACMACYDFATAFETPFISGKDSLYNEFTSGKTHISIPGTLLVTSVGIMRDCSKRISMDFKQVGNPVYVIGETFQELGGSQYFSMHGFIGNNVPKVDALKAKKIFNRISKINQLPVDSVGAVIFSCHDASDGGLGVAFAEMAFAGGLGMQIDLSKIPFGEKILREDFALFSESNTRFVVEVNKNRQKEFEEKMRGVAFAKVGEVTKNPRLVVKGFSKENVLNEDIFELKKSWKKTLNW